MGELNEDMGWDEAILELVFNQMSDNEIIKATALVIYDKKYKSNKFAVTVKNICEYYADRKKISQKQRNVLENCLRYNQKLWRYHVLV